MNESFIHLESYSVHYQVPALFVHRVQASPAADLTNSQGFES